MNETPSPLATTANDAATPTRLTRFWIPVFLLACFAAQSLWFIGTQSLTYDEPGHIIAGLDAWQHGRFEMWTDHPPLGRFWLTLLLARADVHIEQHSYAHGYQVTAMQPGPEWLAWHTRPMNTLLGLALGITLWFATRRLFSVGAANRIRREQPQRRSGGGREAVLDALDNQVVDSIHNALALLGAPVPAPVIPVPVTTAPTVTVTAVEGAVSDAAAKIEGEIEALKTEADAALAGETKAASSETNQAEPETKPAA